MLAVVKTGGKQYLLREGDVVKIDNIPHQPCTGELILDKVLALYRDDKDINKLNIIGQPFIQSAQIKAKVLERSKDKKIIVFKKKRRKNYRRKHGHRQTYMILRITKIEYNNKEHGN